MLTVRFLVLRILLLILVSPSVALAAGGDTPVSQGLKYITDAMFGVTGITLATISIIAVGVLCIFHYLEWKRLLQVVAGTAVIFGASGIVAAIQALVPH